MTSQRTQWEDSKADFGLGNNFFSNITKSQAANAKINKLDSYQTQKFLLEAHLGPQSPGKWKTARGPPWSSSLWAGGIYPKAQTHLVPCDTGRVDTTMMNKHMGEKEKQTASCALARGRTEEAKAVRNRLMWVTSLPPRTTVTSKPGLCQGPYLSLWSYCGILSTAHIPTKGHTDAPGSGLPPMATWLTQGYAVTGARHFWLVCSSRRCHGSKL